MKSKHSFIDHIVNQMGGQILEITRRLVDASELDFDKWDSEVLDLDGGEDLILTERKALYEFYINLIK